ncbi:MAG: hypothetical protein ACI9QN_002805 [Arcticibacterium sp.]|jgi:hypothetical protein
MKKLLLVLFAFASSFMVSAQQNELTDIEKDEAAVKSVVEQFLIASGNYDIEAMPALFCKKANIGGASLKNGTWNIFTMTFEEYLGFIKSESNPTKYTEPVSKYIIHITESKLAFVKADATLITEDKPRSNNFDYFTLLKENGVWKILNGSYVSVPID